MKVLIVDDNVAVQEILKDILSEVGHNVRLAGSIEEAVGKTLDFAPDVVMLDSQIDGEEGLSYITEVRKARKDAELRVVLIKSASEIAPKDIPEIVGCIDKPFKSTEIITMLDGLTAVVAESKAPESSKSKKKIGGILSRKKRKASAPKERPDDLGIFGKSYVVFEHEPERIYDIASGFDPEKYDIMLFTSERAKAIKERFGYEEMEVVPLTSSGKSGTVDIHALGTVSDMACTFIASHERPVVIFDSLGAFVESDGLSLPLMMIEEVMTSGEKEFTLAVSVDDAELTDKDREILLHNMSEYKER